MAIPRAQKKVLILCGDYMEDTEVMVQLQALQAYGLTVDAVCPAKKTGDFCRTAIHFLAGHQTYSELRGHNFALNATFDEIEATEYDGLIIQGGRAPEYLATYKSVLDLVKQFSYSGKPITAMCHGQLVLAAAGLLKGRTCTAYPAVHVQNFAVGRKCTGYPAVKIHVELGGATWLEPEPRHRCFTDGNLVTGADWSGHPEFVSQLMVLLGIRVSF